MYQDLIEQYEKLDEDLKNALLVYKSRLGRAINLLDRESPELEEIYKNYQKLLNDSKNIFMKLTVFKDIDFTSLESFKESLKRVESKVITASSKIKIPREMTVYRMISSENKIEDIAKKDIVSTSLKIDESLKFLIRDNKMKNYLYQINLEEDSYCAICPYAIVLKEDGVLTLTKKYDQEEVILNKNNYLFKEDLTTTLSLKEESITFKVVNGQYKKDVKNTPLKSK